jgi:hypothetical protein
MTMSVAHLQPLAALIAGVPILLVPRHLLSRAARRLSRRAR